MKWERKADKYFTTPNVLTDTRFSHFVCRPLSLSRSRWLLKQSGDKKEEEKRVNLAICRVMNWVGWKINGQERERKRKKCCLSRVLLGSGGVSFGFKVSDFRLIINYLEGSLTTCLPHSSSFGYRRWWWWWPWWQCLMSHCYPLFDLSPFPLFAISFIIIQVNFLYNVPTLHNVAIFQGP
jgi:hypothetical protein